MTQRPPLLSEVAARAGVSLATASRVLNGSGRLVGEPHRTKVLLAARELGYTPNAHAQAIARGGTNVVGLIVHDIADPYFAAIADGVMREAEQRDLVVVLGSTRSDPRREVEYVTMLRAQRALAVILAGSRTTDPEHTKALSQELEAFAATGGRAAAISQNRLGTHTVLALNKAAARELAGRLHRLGHREFAVLAGPENLLTSRDRLTGFCEGLNAAGVPRERIRVLHGDFTRDGAHALTKQLLTEGRLSATCLFAVSDVMAVGAMAALREAGLNVPDDMSVAGFDDIAAVRDVFPGLTTVHLPLEEMGSTAAQLVLDRKSAAHARVVRIRGEVVLRQSTRQLDP